MRKLMILAVALCFLGVKPGLAGEDREPSSLPFPQHETTSDQDEILSEYPSYLSFVLQIGKEVDHANANRLASLYAKLKQKNPQCAARFLKGLRFEMVAKLQLMGAPAQAVSTRTPEIRRWVGRYLKEWVREADEYLFRSYSYAAQEARDREMESKSTK